MSAPRAQAQNFNKFQEEEIKDKERAAKKKQIDEEQRAIEEAALAKPMTEEELAKTNLVEVQPLNILPSDLTNVYRLLPYRLRRQKWGHQFAFGLSTYQPVNYQTHFANASSGSYTGYYQAPTVPMPELNYTYRYNSAFGGLGLDFAFAYFQANSQQGSAIGNSTTFSVQPARIGLKFIMDTILQEPYFAPYVFGGIYEGIYNEVQGNVSFGGNTQISPYYGAGVLVQMNWMDPDSAVRSYNDSGIENTYFYVDIRQYMKSSADSDPDLSSNPVFGGGISMEF